jgi:HSP20 family protein
MNDKHATGRTRSATLLTIIVALIVVIGVLAWHMADLRDQVEAVQAQVSQDTTAVSKQADTRNDIQTQVAQAPSTQQPKPMQTVPDTQATPPPALPQRQFPALNDEWFNQQFNNGWFNNGFNNNRSNRPFASPDWDPYQEIQNMQRQMDEVFNNAFGRFNNSPDFGHLFRQNIVTPDLDVQETNDRYIIKLDVPGAGNNDISVTLDDQVLTVKSEQRYEQKDTDAQGNTVYQERRSGSYRRSITLPQAVIEKDMQSSVENGVLTIIIPKAG